MAKFHREQHKLAEDAPLSANFGVDGLQEARSSHCSLTIFALQFHGCRKVYPVIVQRPSNLVDAKFDKDEQSRALEELIDELK